MDFDALVNSSTSWLQELQLDVNGSNLGNSSYSYNNEWNVDSYLATHWGPKQLPIDVVVPITIVYVLIFVSGVVGNVAVCVVIVRNPSMHTATNCYLFSLAASDLTVLLFGKRHLNGSCWVYSPWLSTGFEYINAICSQPTVWETLKRGSHEMRSPIYGHLFDRFAQRLERLLATIPLGLGRNRLQAESSHRWNVNTLAYSLFYRSASLSAL